MNAQEVLEKFIEIANSNIGIDTDTWEKGKGIYFKKEILEDDDKTDIIYDIGIGEDSIFVYKTIYKISSGISFEEAKERAAKNVIENLRILICRGIIAEQKLNEERFN